MSFDEGRKGAAPHGNKTRSVASPPARDNALLQGRLILMAEDNDVNQNVILRQLALLGYAADLACNGHEALQRWQSGDYALLLTDLHMPKMDGFQLALAIREKEAGDAHIPIIALTAITTGGIEEHCRAVGMDDFLFKPAALADLKAMLENWLPAGPSSGSKSPNSFAESSQCHPVARPVHVNILGALVGDDPTVIRDFLVDFQAGSAKAAAELKAAFENGETAEVSMLAHKLKSSCRSVGALKLGELCADIEQAGKGGQVEALAGLMRRFEAELDAVHTYLDSLQ